MFFFADFIAKQVIEAVADWTGEDDAEVEDTFLKGTRDLQERRAGASSMEAAIMRLSTRKRAIGR